MEKTGLALAVILAAIISQIGLTQALKCYTCIHFVCPHAEHEDCEKIEIGAIVQASKYIEVPSSKLAHCPDPTDTARWALMETVYNAQSSCVSPGSTTCAITRFVVRTYNISQGRSSKLYKDKSYGTVLGCGKRERQKLLARNTDLCDMHTETYTYLDNSGKPSGKVDRVLLENCDTRRNNSCSNCDTCSSDFCISKEKSMPKLWEYYPQGDDVTSKAWIWLMIAFQILIVAVGCLEDLPLYVPSHLLVFSVKRKRWGLEYEDMSKLD